jgi:hypothetical protein
MSQPRAILKFFRLTNQKQIYDLHFIFLKISIDPEYDSTLIFYSAFLDIHCVKFSFRLIRPFITLND